MKIVSFLKRVLMIAGTAVAPAMAQVTPSLTGLLSVVVQSILTAEATSGPKKGEEKMINVLTTMELVAPISIQMMERATGKDLADDELYVQGVKKLVEGVVDILNSFRVLPK